MVLSVRGCLCCGAGPWDTTGGGRGGEEGMGCWGRMSMQHVQGHIEVIKDHGIMKGRCMHHCMASVRTAACAGMVVNEEDLEEHTNTLSHKYSLTHSLTLCHGL